MNEKKRRQKMRGEGRLGKEGGRREEGRWGREGRKEGGREREGSIE